MASYLTKVANPKTSSMMEDTFRLCALIVEETVPLTAAAHDGQPCGRGRQLITSLGVCSDLRREAVGFTPRAEAKSVEITSKKADVKIREDPMG